MMLPIPRAAVSSILYRSPSLSNSKTIRLLLPWAHRVQPGVAGMSMARACLTVSWSPYDHAAKPTAKSDVVTRAPSPRLPKDSLSPIRAASKTRSDRAMRDTQSIAAQLNAGMTTPPFTVAAPTTFEPIDRFRSLPLNLPATLRDGGSSGAQPSRMPDDLPV